MPEEPQIKILSYKRRQFLFLFLFLIFLITLPAMIFYITGYRLRFDNEETSIISTGGMYVTTDNLEVDVYFDGEKEDNPRLFRSAYYIQHIDSGMHTVVVQKENLQTWVKELPIDPHIVIEVAAFNMPLIPHLRPITEYITSTGTAVYQGEASTTLLFANATTTEPFYATTTLKVSDFELNEEFVFVESLFDKKATSSLSVFEKFIDGFERFRFATTSSSNMSMLATTTEEIVEHGDMKLIEHDNEIYAVWKAGVDRIPYYFCVVAESASTTAQRYGEHVEEAIEIFSLSTTTPIMVDGDRLCRPEIKLNRLQQDVYFYDFFPGNSDLVLLQLEDGLYVTEIDDRAWQNTQMLYEGEDFRVVVENDSIYINEGNYYFEIITEIELD